MVVGGRFGQIFSETNNKQDNLKIKNTICKTKKINERSKIRNLKKKLKTSS